MTEPPRAPVVRSDYGLPYSKGLMAQSIMATGLPPERSFVLAAEIERRLTGAGAAEVEVEHLREVAEEVLAAEENAHVVRRFGQWWRLRRLEQPLLVLIGGVTGVGKSTVATQLAGRLGITRVIATDQLRQVVRAFFSQDFMPSVHHSSFDVASALRTYGDDASGTVAGFLRQAHDLAPGIDALVHRAVSEGTPIVLEGVHLLPEIPDPRLRERAVAVRVLLTATDERAHRAHFHARGMTTPRRPDRYLEAFDRIRVLQDYLVERAKREGIPIIDEAGIDPVVARVTEVVLEAVGAEAETGDVTTKVRGQSPKEVL